MAQLRLKRDAFDKAGAGVLLVGMGTPAESAEFKKRYRIPFPLVSDPKRELYRAFGLKQMAAWRLLSPTMALKGMAAMGRGHGLGRPVGDVRQLPGVFIIDSSGRIVFSQPAENAAGHAGADVLLDSLARLNR